MPFSGCGSTDRDRLESPAPALRIVQAGLRVRIHCLGCPSLGMTPPMQSRSTHDSRQTMTVSEAADVLGISRTTAYMLVRSGAIPSLRLRRRIVVPSHQIDAMLDDDQHGVA